MGFMSVVLAEAFQWFCAAHGVGRWGPAALPDDSAFFELVARGRHLPRKVYEALLQENRVHRVHLDLSVMTQLRQPNPECECGGSGAFHVAGGLRTLCEDCMAGEEATTWLVDAA